MPTATRRRVLAARPTAVICDDDPLSRQVLTAALEGVGYEVVGRVANAAAAIQLVTTYQPDVLILDLVLPAMSGEDAIPLIQAASPDCTIIVWSAFDSSAAIRQGALIVVHKGCLDQLEVVLNRVWPEGKAAETVGRKSR